MNADVIALSTEIISTLDIGFYRGKGQQISHKNIFEFSRGHVVVGR